MCIRIGIEDLAGNAFIELLERTNKKEILFRQLDAYGNRVIDVLNRDRNQAVLSLHMDDADILFRNYSDYFESYFSGMDDGIKLKDNISIRQLWKKFRGFLSTEAIIAFSDEKAVNDTLLVLS